MVSGPGIAWTCRPGGSRRRRAGRARVGGARCHTDGPRHAQPPQGEQAQGQQRRERSPPSEKHDPPRAHRYLHAGRGASTPPTCDAARVSGSTPVGSCGCAPVGGGAAGAGPSCDALHRSPVERPDASGIRPGSRACSTRRCFIRRTRCAAVVGGGGRRRGVRADLPECRAAARPAAAMGPDTRCRSGPARPCRLPRQRSRRSECGHRPVEPIPGTVSW